MPSRFATLSTRWRVVEQEQIDVARPQLLEARVHRPQRVIEACSKTDAMVPPPAPRAPTTIHLGGDEDVLAAAKPEDARANVALAGAFAVVIRGVEVAEAS